MNSPTNDPPKPSIFAAMRLPLLLIPLLLALIGCASDTEENINIRLTMEERERINELVSTEMDSLRPLYDSICKADFEDRVAVATDSIVQRMLEEEARLRARIPQNQRR
jgi:hypothetical protein